MIRTKKEWDMVVSEVERDLLNEVWEQAHSAQLAAEEKEAKEYDRLFADWIRFSDADAALYGLVSADFLRKHPQLVEVHDGFRTAKVFCPEIRFWAVVEQYDQHIKSYSVTDREPKDSFVLTTIEGFNKILDALKEEK